ncbi:chalcone isomerase family protein, partial [Vibrio parahaemolyticus]
VQVNGRDLTLNGLGVRKATFLEVNVYVAAYYVGTPGRDPKLLIEADGPQQLTLQFVRNVGVNDLRKAFVEGFEHAQVAGLG